MIKLTEGKKDAIRVLTKAGLSGSTLNMVLSIIGDYDNSRTNKYHEVFARCIVSLDEFDSSVGEAVSAFTHLIDLKVVGHLEIIEEKNLPIDLSKIKYIEDLIDEAKKVASKLVMRDFEKLSLSGFKEGVDYIEIDLPEPYQAFIPLNYEASASIASKSLGGVKGKWCTAYSKNHWETYIHQNNEILVYILNLTEEEYHIRKIAIQTPKSGEETIWDAEDHDYTVSEFYSYISKPLKDSMDVCMDYVIDNSKKIRDLLMVACPLRTRVESAEFFEETSFEGLVEFFLDQYPKREIKDITDSTLRHRVTGHTQAKVLLALSTVGRSHFQIFNNPEDSAILAWLCAYPTEVGQYGFSQKVEQDMGLSTDITKELRDLYRGDRLAYTRRIDEIQQIAVEALEGMLPRYMFQEMKEFLSMLNKNPYED